MVRRILFLSLAAVLLLSGCMITLISADTRVTFKPAEKWDLQIGLVFPGDVAQLYGSEIVDQMNQAAQDVQSEGVVFEYNFSDPDENGNVALQLHFQGQGYDVFNQTMGDMGSVEVEQKGNKKILYIQWTDIGSGMVVQNGSTLTIQGGKILSSNGNQLNATTVEWYNPITVDVVMEEPGGVSLLGIGLIALGAVCILLGVGWWLGWFRPKTGPQAVIAAAHSGPPPTARYCSNCGAPLSPAAQFCGKCGMKNG